MISLSVNRETHDCELSRSVSSWETSILMRFSSTESRRNMCSFVMGSPHSPRAASPASNCRNLFTLKN